ncbi:MAG: amidohydrolase [Candidatus Cloacimonadota bacterium]|nr:amidohydrolase [Candidatus Cloacimonadota bacterium]
MSILIKNVLLNSKQKDLLIKGNLISKIADSINEKADEIIIGNGKAVLPSFINSHTHSAMILLRGYADDMLLMDWLQNRIWPLEAKLTEDDVYWGAKLACLEMIKSGTTFFNDMYWHFNGTARATDEMGIRAMISGVFIDGGDFGKAKDQINLNEKLFKHSKKISERISFSLGPHAIYTVSEFSLRWIKNFAYENNLMIHIHLSETEQEVKDCLKLHGKRPVEYLHDIGFLGANLVAAHVIHVNEKELHLLHEFDVKIAHSPVSNMKICSGILPMKAMLEKGLTVGLGTDGCSSNNNLDMLEEMKFAALLHKINNFDPQFLPAEKTFEIATKNGATIFNLNCGEIKEGKLADLILVDLNNINLIPNHNLISNMVYSAHADCVDTTICDGKILMQNRQVEGEEEIKAKAAEVAKKLVHL